MPPIPPPDRSGMTTSTELPLYWCAYGPDNPPAGRVLVLHGGPGASHDYLLPQMLQLAGGGGRELLFYDQRGGGQSKSDDRSPVTWLAHVADLAAVVRELALEPLTLVGYSWGALLALLYAGEAARDARIPRVERLVLLDPAPLTRAWRAEFEAEFARRQAGADVQALRQELADSDLRTTDPEAYRHRAFELSVAGYFSDPRRARDLTPFRVTGRVQQSVWDSLGEFDLLADHTLAGIRVPSLVIHGRQDPIPLASSEACARALGAGLVVLEDCGHVPYVEQPSALFAAIEEFLTM
ncbi:MAG: putative hydrolase [Gemmatimonadetes bacterium]|nr:putative hydrolase [Gemmatimonadota bacterium]